MDRPCTLLVNYGHGETPNVSELKAAMEKGTDAAKADALKKAIAMTLAGEPLPGVLMHVIRFILPSRHHIIKKLLLLYLEAVDKVDEQGKLKPEFILVWYVTSSLHCFSSTKIFRSEFLLYLLCIFAFIMCWKHFVML